MLERIDHIYLSVRDFDRSEAFYDRVMAALGQHKGNKAIAGERHAHYTGPQFQLSIRPARSEAAHDPYAPGLHHLCFQVASERDVDRCYFLLAELGLAPIPPRRYPEYHPEYYATFFEDPDGIRLEIVNRTAYRVALETRWEELDGFLNPLQRLPENDPAVRGEGAYPAERRETIAEAPGLRVRLLALSAGQCVPWHYHTHITDRFFCMDGPMQVSIREPHARHLLVPGGTLAVPPRTAHRVTGVDGGACRFMLVQGVGEYDFVPAAVEAGG